MTRDDLIESAAQAALTAALSACGMATSGTDAQTAIYRQTYAPELGGSLVDQTQRAAAYANHRAKILEFLRAHITATLDAALPERLEVADAAVIPAAYPAYVNASVSGSGYTIDLPSGSLRPGEIVISRGAGTGTVTISASGGETIAGSATTTLTTNYQTIRLVRQAAYWTLG